MRILPRASTLRRLPNSHSDSGCTRKQEDWTLEHSIKEDVPSFENTSVEWLFRESGGSLSLRQQPQPKKAQHHHIDIRVYSLLRSTFLLFFHKFSI